MRDELMKMGVQLLEKNKTWKHRDGTVGRIPEFNELKDIFKGQDISLVMANAGNPDAINDPMELARLQALMIQDNINQGPAIPTMQMEPLKLTNAQINTGPNYNAGPNVPQVA